MVNTAADADKQKSGKGTLLLLLIPLFALLLFQLFPTGSTTTGGMTAQEKRIADALTQLKGAGRVHVVLHTPESNLFSDGQMPAGVLILCEGAHDLTVQLRISLAVQTLLNLDAGQIRIFPMEVAP